MKSDTVKKNILLILCSILVSCQKINNFGIFKRGPASENFRKISSENLYAQIQDLGREKSAGFGIGLEMNGAGHGIVKSFELLPFTKEEEPLHLFCAGGFKFGDIASISGSISQIRRLRCENHQAYSGYFLNMGMGVSLGVGVSGSIS